MGGSEKGSSDFGNIGGSGGGGGGDPPSCPLYVARTQLVSPVPGIADKLSAGDKLTLELSNGSSPIVAKTSENKAAGAVAPIRMSFLVDCMNEGNRYTATVVSAISGAVTVDIRWEGQ